MRSPAGQRSLYHPDEATRKPTYIHHLVEIYHCSDNVVDEELLEALKDCGWMKIYLGEGVTKEGVINSTFSGKSSMCLVM